MAYTLNTNHPLYANLVELIGVENGELVSLKTARTFTPADGSSFGTGTYGEHFTCVSNGYTPKGASFSPSIALPTNDNPNYTVMLVLNARQSGGGSAALVCNTAAYGLAAPTWNSANLIHAYENYNYKLTGSTTLSTGAQMLTSTRQGESAGNLKLYVNDALDSSGNPEYNASSAALNYIGGYPGQGSVGASVVWIPIFNKVLSLAEISSLYDSLGADNAFGLVQAAGNADATAAGALDTLDLIAPTGVGTGTSAGSTNGAGTGSLASCSLVSIAGAGAGTVAGSGTLTTAILMNNAKVPYASLSGWTLNIFNKSTGALVLQVTGLSTDASGRLSVTNAALTAGTEYSYEPVHITYGRRLPLGTAA